MRSRPLLPLELPPHWPPHGTVHALTGQSMGTTWSVKLVLTDKNRLDDLQQGIQAQLDQVVAQMSHWHTDSDLDRFNCATPGSWCMLPDEFFSVLHYAQHIAMQTNGAFQPAAGALINLWGFGPGADYRNQHAAPPDAAEISAVLAAQHQRQLILEPVTRRALQPGGIVLDLSAIAKGFAVDQIARYLLAQQIFSCLIEVGGELRGTGIKPDGQPWWVTLEQPAAETAVLPEPIVVALHGMSVATSGDYLRCFHHAGQSFAHTLDPRTGYPITHGVASVTVLHRECMAADAFSTALTVLGVEAGLAFAEQHQLAARFLCRHPDGSLTEHMSRAFRAMLQ